MKRADTLHSSSGIQVISRAASILRALEHQANGLSLSEIALRVGLPRSTVQRIVNSLAEEQFLIAASPRSRVKLGPALIRLANATTIEISPLVRPLLEALSQKLKETVDLSFVQAHDAVFVDQVQGSHRLRAVSAIGERFPLHCTACGKALLAAASESQVQQLIGTQLERFTENTITDFDALADEIRRAREDRFALDVEEHTEGISAIGTWFEDAYGRAFAVSIPAPTVRFARSSERFKEAILECREQIVNLLGDHQTDDK